MKLSLDCMRDVLFLLEDNLTISSDLELSSYSLFDISNSLGNYKIGEIANMLIVLREAGFIVADEFYSSDCIEDILVSRITYSGYQLIENIRPETVWKKIQIIAPKVGTFSINVVSQIATSVITSLINAQLGL